MTTREWQRVNQWSDTQLAFFKAHAAQGHRLMRMYTNVDCYTCRIRVRYCD